MAFLQAAAPTGLRSDPLLSADNAIPERHIVVATLRNAAPRLGLSTSVLTTLDAMLSCLAPKRNHHTVFASNATLTFRRNGISDRTIRRHAAALQEIGLLVRRDSPNGKRFTKHSRHDGKALRFGFDLTPLFERLHEIAALAAEVLRERDQIDYVRSKIRSAANHSLQHDPNNIHALNTLRVLRRKLSLTDCEKLLADQPLATVQAEAEDDIVDASTATLAASDGQNVRHYHRSNKEDIDKEEKPVTTDTPGQNQGNEITIPELLRACPEASQFALDKVTTHHDVIAHARTLAPMLGINNHSYDAAQLRLGAMGAAMTVWAIMQFHEKIKSVGAYFRSLTTGAKSADFSPEKLVKRLASSQTQLA
ncbi:replication protein C (plasmid) [Parasedimentitalea marina]|uniref:Replication protein C n=1 Tax=Parasedimentitalea marina TaxID=2483033 RepID=A0A3T0N9Y2_9RHOB|nr:plasmid replication protein RepC [Parasedimentitalea marina]AZV80838.1 replication protein C [Parasedimentitalea marina]